MQYYLILLLLLSATACLQKEITLDFPASEPRLVLEGVLTDSLPFVVAVGKTANFNEEAFTYNVPNTTQVWVWKDGAPYVQLQSAEAMGFDHPTSPFSGTVFALDTNIRLEVGSQYSMRVSLAGFPTLETEAVTYEGRRPAEDFLFTTYVTGDNNDHCRIAAAQLIVANADNKHFTYGSFLKLIGDPGAMFPDLPEETRDQIREEEYLAEQYRRIFAPFTASQTIFQTSGNITFFENFTALDISQLLATTCSCEPEAVYRYYMIIIESDTSFANYQLAKRQYIDFGDAGLFGQQNLPSIPHNIINGYGYFGLANAYNFPLCN